MAAPRSVVPELLDELPPADLRAQRSRRDLRRVHYAMRTVPILRHAVAGLRLPRPPRRILELGAGDGSLLLRLARRLRPAWTGVELTLLDRHDLVDARTHDGYRQLGWRVQVLCEDALGWAVAPPGCGSGYDLCFASLFLHHFSATGLALLLAAVAARCDGFVACEPRRDGLARAGSRLVGLIGGNAVTREDAVKSVDAGFSGHELTAAWQRNGGDWILAESRALPFAHCFSAARAHAAIGSASHAL
jgi:hypothetical protein